MRASSSAMRTRVGSLLTGAEPSDVRPGGHLPLGCAGAGHDRHAPVPQSAEGADSKPAQCAFESHRGHSAHCDPPDRTAATCRSPLALSPTVAAARTLRAHSPRQDSSPSRGTPSAPLASPWSALPANYGGLVTEPAPHMTPEQFRQHGHEVVDWIADYWSRIESLPGALAGLPRRGPRRPAGHRPGAGRAVLRRPRRPRPRSSCPGRRTGSTPASSATSRPTRPAPRSSATWSPPASASRACPG